MSLVCKSLRRRPDVTNAFRRPYHANEVSALLPLAAPLVLAGATRVQLRKSPASILAWSNLRPGLRRDRHQSRDCSFDLILSDPPLT
jgi:hypothetical protein